MWNCKVLPPPPYCEMKTLLTPAERGCLLHARKHLKKCEEPIHDHVKLLTTELFVTKRIIYRLNNQFRSDKAVQTLKQVRSCMKRLEAVNFEKQLSDTLQIVDRLPNSNESEVYLTSRQVLEYHLVMLQGAAALLRQMIQYCQKTFIHVRQHLELGNMIPNNLVLLALTSRIWFVCNSLGLYVCNWYGKLYPCLALLKPTAVTWFQGEELPADLSEWLTELFKDIGLSENFCTELKSSAEVEKMNGTLPSNVEFLETADQEDLGEPIQRKQIVAEPDDFTEVEPTLTQISTFNKRSFEIDKEKDEVNKKQKLSVGDESGDINVDIVNKESTECWRGKKHKHLETSTAGTGDVEEVATFPEVSISAHLENVLHTYQAVDNIIKQVKSGTVEISGMSMKLTGSGRKKIMKHVERWKRLMQEKGSLSETEQLFVKKVKGPLSELLVKYCEHQTRQENKSETGTDHKEKIAFCSPVHGSVVVDGSVQETNDIHEDNPTVKRRKKKKGKTKIEVNSNEKKVGLSVKTGNKTEIKKKAKKKKRKPQRK